MLGISSDDPAAVPLILELPIQWRLRSLRIIASVISWVAMRGLKCGLICHPRAVAETWKAMPFSILNETLTGTM